MSIKNNALTGANGQGTNKGESMPDKDIKITPQFDPEILQEVEAAEPITPAEVMAEADKIIKSGGESNKSNSNLLESLKIASAKIIKAAQQDIVYSPAWINLEDAPIFAKGTINVIQGKAGVHKSRLAETFCSLLLSPLGKGDFLGFSRHNLGAGYFVAYIDTERNTTEDFPVAIQRIRQRAGLDKREDNGKLYPTSIKQVDRKQRLDAVKAWIDFVRSEMEQKGVSDWNLFCVLDVVTDCTSSFNREDETLALFDYLGNLCENYKVTFLLVIHENPFSEKARGHAGTEAMNKANTQLQISYESGSDGEPGDLIKIRFLKTRNAARPQPLYLQYSKEQNGLITADPTAVTQHIESRKKNNDIELLVEHLQSLFDAVETITKKDLCKAIVEKMECSESTAQRRLDDITAKRVTIIDKAGRKCHLVKEGEKGKATIYRLEANESKPTRVDLAANDELLF